MFTVYCAPIAGCVGVLILSFFQGSVGVNSEFTFESDAPTEGVDLMTAILDAADDNGNDVGGGFVIVPEALTIQGKLIRLKFIRPARHSLSILL